MTEIKLSAEETLLNMIGNLVYYLDELEKVPTEMRISQFIEGERTAYVECLEMIKFWEKAEKSGLDFDLERVYKLERY